MRDMVLKPRVFKQSKLETNKKARKSIKWEQFISPAVTDQSKDPLRRHTKTTPSEWEPS